jgi:hypothetical protein
MIFDNSWQCDFRADNTVALPLRKSRIEGVEFAQLRNALASIPMTAKVFTPSLVKTLRFKRIICGTSIALASH